MQNKIVVTLLGNTGMKAEQRTLDQPRNPRYVVHDSIMYRLSKQYKPSETNGYIGKANYKQIRDIEFWDEPGRDNRGRR